MYAIYEQKPAINKNRSALMKIVRVKYETPDFSKENIKTKIAEKGLIKKINTNNFFMNFNI